MSRITTDRMALLLEVLMHSSPLSLSLSLSLSHSLSHSFKRWLGIFPSVKRAGQWVNGPVIFFGGGGAHFFFGILIISSASFVLHPILQILSLATFENSPGLSDGQMPQQQRETSPSTVFFYVGTMPHLRRKASLRWRLGPTFLINDFVDSATLQKITQLGPNYMGSFQASDFSEG